jgi:hypothetical protein
MVARLDADEAGRLTLPAEMLGGAVPHRRFVVEVLGGRVILSPDQDTVAFAADRSSSDRAREFLEWSNEPRPQAPDIPDDALRRENIYE